MMKDAIIGIAVVLVVLGLVLALILHEREQDRSIVEDDIRIELTTGSGQHVRTVPRSEFQTWMRTAAPNIDIVSIAAIGDGSYGILTGFVVVYEDVEK